MQQTIPTIKGLLFDLDGTLVDSVPDIAFSINQVLAGSKHPPLAVNEVRAMIGNGIQKLVERAFTARHQTLTQPLLAKQTQKMLQVYQQHLTVATEPMKGAAALIELLAENNYPLAVVTNKPRDPACQIIKSFGWNAAFNAVVGGDSTTTRKPAPEMILFACDQLGLCVDECIMVGDSQADVDAARAANMKSIVIRGGYTNTQVEDLRADFVLNSLEDLRVLFTSHLAKNKRTTL